MNKILPALLAAALALPAAAQPPKIKTAEFTAKYCPKPTADSRCSEFTVSRPVFADQAQNAFAENLIRKMSVTDGLKTLSKAAALRELKKRVDEFRDNEGYPRHQYIAEVSLEGYTPHYYVLSTTDYEYSGGAHGAGDGGSYVIPRSGKPVPLKLADILLPGKKAAFAALHRQGMLDYYLQEGGKTRQELEADFDDKNSPHHLTDEHLENWTFDKNALSYTYGTYSFGSYIDTPSFILPADKLQGIVKPEILRELKAYREVKR
ncbi:hypothetical protein HMPREF9120_00170 [Neisseria sp. oral taxon 020 str. F0370]|uniref:PdaC/SigV domain-containing protein n=1 Tax=unclassified Neisseria TaxID=2623750 RepID=UPI0002A2F86C|nr:MULTISPECIES: DUF4163 domain-containing protein [unclassified Neisseria]ASP18060.1 DUF4163 domain-containing protein [Neisseria sp. KEM232]EKY10061.1 hypothetical protein HMPREF9120_00170 [Neisseria sp. oral taxon 020 str. F0370]